MILLTLARVRATAVAVLTQAVTKLRVLHDQASCMTCMRVFCMMISDLACSIDDIDKLMGVIIIGYQAQPIQLGELEE